MRHPARLLVDSPRRRRLNQSLAKIKEQQEINPADEPLLTAYFNLCGEEYLYYKLGYIYPEVWSAWRSGMQFCDKEPQIRERWARELEQGCYYGLAATIPGKGMNGK